MKDRIGTIDARLIALDARTGAVCRGVGDGGTVRLRKGLRNSPYYVEEYELTSPPAIINGTIVTGSVVADNGRTNAASGEVRAYDARTGALKWMWDPIPRDPTDAAWSSWRGAMAHTTGAANAWSVIALVAIDLTSGAKAWSVPLGDPPNLRPGTSPSAPALGLPNLGGRGTTSSPSRWGGKRGRPSSWSWAGVQLRFAEGPQRHARASTCVTFPPHSGMATRAPRHRVGYWSIAAMPTTPAGSMTSPR